MLASALPPNQPTWAYFAGVFVALVIARNFYHRVRNARVNRAMKRKMAAAFRRRWNDE